MHDLGRERSSARSPLRKLCDACIGAFSFLRLGRLPLAETTVALTALLFVARDRSLVLRERGHVLIAAACALIALSLTAAGGTGALIQVLQLAFVLLAAPLIIARAAKDGARAIRNGIAVMWLVSVAIALVQRLIGVDPPELGAFLGSRAVYGLAIAATAPFALSAIDERLRERSSMVVRGIPALLIVLAAWTILYLPALLLLLASFAAWTILCAPRNRRITGAAALALLLVAAAFGPGTWGAAHRQSVAPLDADGIPRRWTLEASAARASIAARPLLGHGPGSYQTVVSSTRFRSGLADTAENRVEPNAQSAYTVLALEHGMPAVALLLVAFALALLRLVKAEATLQSDSPAKSDTRTRAIALATFALGMFWIHPLVTSAGILVSTTLGLAYASAAHLRVEEAPPVRLWQKAWLHAAVLVFAVLLGLMAGSPPSDLEREMALSGRGQTIVIDAENADSLPPYLVKTADRHAAGEEALAVPEAERKYLIASAGALYKLDLADEGVFRVWLRARWPDGCGNSCAVSVNHGAPMLVGNDGTYKIYHWVRGPVVQLHSGENALSIFPREGGARIDQLMLTDDAGMYPSGPLESVKSTPVANTARASAPGEDAKVPAVPADTSHIQQDAEQTADPSAGDVAEHDEASAPQPQPDPPQLPAWTSAGRDAREEFVCAIGGAYRGGSESFMVTLGIPYDRLREDQLSDAATLSRYGVVWISAPQTRVDRVWEALLEYVSQGGVAVLEKMGERFRSYNPTDAETKLLGGMRMRSWTKRGLSVKGEGSPLFAGTPDDTQVHDDVTCWAAGQINDDNLLEIHGGLYRGGERIGPVFTKRRVGKGYVYALMVPLGFTTMWRGPTFERLGKSILMDAVGDRYDPLYAEFKYDGAPRGAVNFADDFQREPGRGSHWQVERGSFGLTGSKPKDLQRAFSLRSKGDAVSVTGNPGWRSYRLSATIDASNGRGGIWLTTSAGKKLALDYDGRTGKASLYHEGDERAELGVVTADEPHAGWRRLSLFHRDGSWNCWLDARPLMKIDSPKDDALGRFGIINSDGMVYYDDVLVCDVAELVPGRDVRVGEDASPYASPPLSVGLEPKTIYSPQWTLRPDRLGRHALQIPVPTYAESVLRMNERTLGSVAPGGDDFVVYLPKGEKPRTDIELICPQWRDFTFGKRPAGWYATGGVWGQLPRWSCDPRWSWLGTDTTDKSAFWYREKLTPPYCFYIIAAASTNPRTEMDEGRDLNLIFGGNGRDLGDGILIKVERHGAPGIEMWMGGKLVAHNANSGLPSGHALHHRWFELKTIVEPRRIRFYYEGELALDVPLDTDAPTGRAAFWTDNNSVRLARAIVSIAQP